MKILYYSDKYAYNVMGTKRATFEEVQSRGIQIIWKDKSLLRNVLLHIEEEKPTQVWLASSDLLLPFELKRKIKIPVIAFGFSDPSMFNAYRLHICDIYVSNYYDTIVKHKHRVPMIYYPPACDFRFHKRVNSTKKFDITMIGCGDHSRFKNPMERIEIVNRLRDDGFDVWAFGNGWPKHPKNNSHIEGQKFLDVINSSKIGLDIQEDFLPLAHRMFEYPACGVPIVTKKRDEVFSFFEKDTEIKTYSDYESLKTVLSYLLKDGGYKLLGEKAFRRCRKNHNISNRVAHLLDKLKELL